MSVNLNATFDKTPSVNWDALQTFETSIEEDDEIATSFTTLAADKYPAIAFTQALFEAKPELFGPYAMSLIYAQHSGTSYKPEAVYAMFEQYIKYGPKAIIEVLKSRPARTYEFCPNYLILWAKLLRNTRMTISFEPIMTKLNKVLNDFFGSKKVIIKGVKYDLSIFKPLCYTRTGECYFAILPYIAYLVTFMVDCRPYSFNEAQSDSSAFGFLTSLNSYFQKYYTAFKEDTNIDLVKSDPYKLPPTISDNHIMNMMKKMLHPDGIISVRNDEIAKTPELLNECIKDQSDLSDNYVSDAFMNTMNRLIKIIIQQNPLKHIFDAVPRFRNDNKGLNIQELMNWTQYCLSGGDKPFLIESTIHSKAKNIMYDYTNVFHIDPAKVVSYPESICGKPLINSKIDLLNISKQLPFNENDIVLNMCTAYVDRKFDMKRNDILDGDPIAVNETMLWHENVFRKPLSVVLKDLFLNGIWGYENSVMAKVLDQLCNIPEFVSEINDILSLSNITQLVYSNQLASTVISTYILSFLNTWILDSVVHGFDLRYMRPYRYIVRSSADGGRIGKLCDMVMSLLYIGYDKYALFVNNTVKEFITIMEQSPCIQQPYIKRLNDMADVYAIGGCELYRWATHPNPLVRGCMWYYNVFGWSEELETFFIWVSSLTNSALMELFESNVNETAVIDSTLKSQLEKMIELKKYPLLLNNYEFDSSLGYKEKRYAYVLGLKNSGDKSMTSLIVQRIFKRSTAGQSTSETIWFKRIMYKNGEVVARKAYKNSIDINDKLFPADLRETGIPMLVPIYDTIGKIDEVKVIRTTPPGHRMIQLVLGNSRNRNNQTILIYTPTAPQTRFG